MTTPATVSNAIDQNARGPKSVRVGGESVEQHPIADQIAADQYAKGQTAAGKNHLGLRFIQIVPPGAG